MDAGAATGYKSGAAIGSGSGSKPPKRKRAPNKCQVCFKQIPPIVTSEHTTKKCWRTSVVQLVGASAAAAASAALGVVGAGAGDGDGEAGHGGAGACGMGAGAGSGDGAGANARAEAEAAADDDSSSNSDDDSELEDGTDGAVEARADARADARTHKFLSRLRRAHAQVSVTHTRTSFRDVVRCTSF